MTGLFTVWLEQRAWDAVERMKGTCSEDTYKARLNAVAELITAGKFGEGSDCMLAAAASYDGMKYGTFLQLRACDPEITERLVQEMFAEKGDEVWKKVVEANSDPLGDGGSPPETPPISPNCSPPSAESPGVTNQTKPCD
jgi:hypothetical protein